MKDKAPCVSWVWLLFWIRTVPLHHGLVNYMDTKAKCRHPKNWPVKGLCGRCSSEFIDWRYSQPCWYISDPVLWTVATLTFSLAQVLSLVGDYILQEFNTLYMTRFRTYKLLDPPKQKPRRWVGLRKINTCHKVPLQVNFFTGRHFALVSIRQFWNI